MKRTKRGFRIYSEQKDSYGVPFRIQESSNAMMRACWIFVEDPEYRKQISPTGTIGPALHLSEGQARRVIVALNKFLGGC